MADKKNRLELLNEFHAAPIDSLFTQSTIAALRGCSTGTVERDRVLGIGVPFIKIGHGVRYRKSDYLAWEKRHQSVNSTIEARVQAMRLRGEVLNAVAASREG